MEFKILKRPAKRKPPNVPAGWRKAKRRKIRSEDQEPKMPLLETVEDPHHGQEEKENTDKPAGRLANLRSRIKAERQNVIDYMDKKRELEILADIALFWNDQEMKLNLKDGKGREHSRRKANRKLRNQLNHSGKHANLLLEDWLGWWGRMERGPARQSKVETDDFQGYYPTKPTPNRLERMVVTDGG